MHILEGGARPTQVGREWDKSRASHDRVADRRRACCDASLLPACIAACYRSHPSRKTRRGNRPPSCRRARSPRMQRVLNEILRTLVLSEIVVVASVAFAAAQKKYDPGVTDTEIKIGNIIPYSGPASAYGIIGKTMSAYFRMINDNGGI